jgi:GNAT superfamily N-acetyltransferase
VKLHEVSPDDRDGRARLLEVMVEVNQADSPWQHPLTPAGLEAAMRHGWDGEPSRYFLVEDAGVAVGVAEISTSDYDNLDLAGVGVAVRPGSRRHGYGRKVLDELSARCADLGRPSLVAESWDDTAARGFAAAMGWPQKSVAICRRLHVDEVPPERFEQLAEDARRRAGDYDLLRIEGASPDELLEPIADLTATINDAPLDELEIEDEVFSAQRIRAYESAQTAGSRRLYRLLARHQATGNLAGHTVAVVEADRPTKGHQHDTAVARAHRGHGLGVLLKAEMMRWLAETEPGLRTLDTWNAESNGHMIAVNELLGYRPMSRGLSFQHRIPT